MYSETDVPAEIPFKTHVSHGLLRGLRPPVPLPDIVDVAEFTADATSANNNNAALAATREDNNDLRKNFRRRRTRET